MCVAGLQTYKNRFTWTSNSGLQSGHFAAERAVSYQAWEPEKVERNINDLQKLLQALQTPPKNIMVTIVAAAGS